MLRKIVLLVGTAMALVVFAGPGVASADIWTLNGVPVGQGTAEGVTFDGTGELSATRTIPAGKVKLGPCVVHIHGTVWNDPTTETGHGEVDSLQTTTPCEIYLNGNKICTITNAFSEGYPWTITVTSGTAIDIHNFNRTEVFSPGCPLGPGSAMSGTATGQWTNAGSSISFNESGDLTTVGGAPVLLDGSIGITPTGIGGGTLALE